MSRYKSFKHLLNSMVGPAAFWRQRIRRKLDHPEFKTITEPSYEEIIKLCDQVEALQGALSQAVRECEKLRSRHIYAGNKLGSLSKRIMRLVAEFKEKP